MLPLPASLRIQVLLHDLVEPEHAQIALLHRRHDLDIRARSLHIAGQVIPDQFDRKADNAVRVILLHKEKIAAFVRQFRADSVIDPVRVHDDVALLCLPENRLQRNHRNRPGFNHILQHRPRSHARQLVGVPRHYQMGADRHSLQQRMEKIEIYHRHLIHDDHVLLQRFVLVPSELQSSIRVPRYLKQPVNGLRLPPGRFGHSLGRPAGRRRQGNRQPLILKYGNHRIDGCRFSGSGAAGQNQKPAAIRLQDCLHLLCVQFGSRRLLGCKNTRADSVRIPLRADIQVVQHLRAAKLRHVNSRSVDPHLAFFLPDHQLPFYRKVLKTAFDRIFPIFIIQIPFCICPGKYSGIRIKIFLFPVFRGK